MSIEDGPSWQEHLERISKLGGNARAKSLSAKRKSSIAKKGGKVGGKAAAAALTPEERKARAQKGAAASLAVRRAKAAERKAGKANE